MTSARPSAALQPPADTRRTGRIRSETISTAAIFALAILLIFASRFVSPALGSWDQVDTIITLASFLIVVAFGQGLVILVGGLDLSVASVITLGGVLATTWNGSLGSEWVLIPAVLLICACVGALNAIGVIWLNHSALHRDDGDGHHRRLRRAWLYERDAARRLARGLPCAHERVGRPRFGGSDLCRRLRPPRLGATKRDRVRAAALCGRRQPRSRAHRGHCDVAADHGRLCDQRCLRGLRGDDAGRLREWRDFADGGFLPLAEHRRRRHRRIVEFSAAAAASREQWGARSFSPRSARSSPRSAWKRDGARSSRGQSSLERCSCFERI